MAPTLNLLPNNAGQKLDIFDETRDGKFAPPLEWTLQDMSFLFWPLNPCKARRHNALFNVWLICAIYLIYRSKLTLTCIFRHTYRGQYCGLISEKRAHLWFRRNPRKEVFSFISYTNMQWDWKKLTTIQSNHTRARMLWSVLIRATSQLDVSHETTIANCKIWQKWYYQLENEPASYRTWSKINTFKCVWVLLLNR